MNLPVQAVVLHVFPVPAERVFDAWLDASRLGRWMFGPSVRNEKVVRLSLDPRVGGKFSFVVDRDGTLIDHVGEYLEIERPRRLVFTWGTRDQPADISRVIVEVIPTNTGCQLKLIHEMNAKWAGFVDRAAGSWHHMLTALAATLTVPLSPT